MSGSFIGMYRSLSSSLNEFDSTNPPASLSPHVWFNSLVCRVFGAVRNDTHAELEPPRDIVGVILQERYGDLLAVGAKGFIAHSYDNWGGGKAQPAGFGAFVSLGLADLYQRDVFLILQAKLEKRIKETISGVYDESFLSSLLHWTEGPVSSFLRGIYPAASSYQPMLASIQDHVRTALVHQRSEEMFDIVADFPDSIVAIKELRDVSNTTNSLNIVGKSFRKSLQRRLLHIGASTQQILDMYVSAIRVLRIIDPSDALLHYVTKPVRKYLRQRKDTIRSIVTSLTQSKQSGSGETSELHGELKKGGGSLSFGVLSEDEDGGPGGAGFEEWQPAKRHPDISYSFGRGYDIVALLVSIYESTDLFVSEYRSVLSEKLLQSSSYDGDAEISTLELLKIRFGEDSLHNCEVILHDLEVSRRTNAVLASELTKHTDSNMSAPFPIDYLVVSDNYWPPMAGGGGDGGPRDHPAVANRIKEYCDAFEILKKPRKLHPIPDMGVADLELEFKDGSVRKFKASPLQTSLIMFLAEQEDSSLSLSRLAELVNGEQADIRRRMGFWTSKSVVTVDLDPSGGEDVVYRVVEEQTDWAVNSGRDDACAEDYEQKAIPAVLDACYDNVFSDIGLSKSQDKECERFIRGMLSNQEAMPLERVHTMLRLVTSGSSDAGFSFDMNLVQFKKFMQSLCDADILEIVESGSYRLRRGGI